MASFFQSTAIRFGILQWICILMFVYESAPQQPTATPRTETRTYQYEYDIISQYHNESKGPDGVVKGEYGHWSPDGWFRITNYTADKDGYRVNRRRLRARKGQFGTGSQTGFPQYPNRQPQGGAAYGPPGSEGTLGAPGGNTPRTPYSSTPYGAGVGVNGVGGPPGLGGRPGNQQTYGTGLISGSGSAGSSPSNFGQQTAESHPVEVKGGVLPLGVYPNQRQPSGTLVGRQPWTAGSDIATARPGTGLGGSISHYPIAAHTTKIPSTEPFKTLYPGFRQTTPPSQSYQYPPSGPGIQGQYPGPIEGGGGDGGLSSKPTGPVTSDYGQKTGEGGASGPYGSELPSTDGAVGSSVPYGSGVPSAGGPYGSGLPGTGGINGPFGGVTTKTSDASEPYGSGLPSSGGASRPYGGEVPKTGGVTNPYGSRLPGTDGASATYNRVKPKTSEAPYGGVEAGTGFTGTSQQPGEIRGGMPSGAGGAKWPYGGATTSYPGSGQKPGYPPVRYEFPEGQASDRSCRLEPGHSTIPVGFPNNLQPLGVARDDHSTPDGKMLGKYTLTFPFGYIMEISYSAYQDPALAAKYLPQQTHNPNC